MTILPIALFSAPEVSESERKNRFDKDEKGNYMVYRVVETNRPVPGKVLYDHALNYFHKAESHAQVEEDRAGRRLSARGKVRLSRHAGIGNYIAGDIHYRLTMEMKDGKYRYWLTELVYQPYVKDRYGRIVPVRGKMIPLETQVSKLNKGIWEKQRGYAFDEIKRLAEDLKDHMRPLAKQGRLPDKRIRIESDREWARQL